MNPAAPPAGGAPTADLVIAGAAGRMGSRIVALARETPDVRVVAALEAPGHPALGRDAGETAGIAVVSRGAGSASLRISAFRPPVASKGSAPLSIS